MLQINYILSLFLILLLACCCLPDTALAGDKAKGTLTVDGNVVEIKHAAARPLFDDIIILLTDNPANKESVPDGVASLSGQKKIKGIMFSISAKNKRLLGKGESIQGIYFNPVWDQLGMIGNGEVNITYNEGDILKGKIYTPSENRWIDHSFSYEIEFEVSTKKQYPKVSITGDNDGPSSAYSSYYRAVMKGDKDEFKKYIAEKRLQEIEREPGMLEFFIEMQQELAPTDVNILSTEIKGDKALLIVIGSRGSAKSEGTIDMVKENNRWKVDLESWISGEIE